MRTISFRQSRLDALRLAASLSGGARSSSPDFVAPAALMTSAMSLHFFGYECARAASLSLLRQAEQPFTDASVAVLQGMAAPVASVMLVIYSLLLTRVGPRKTLTAFGLGSACVLALFAFLSSHTPVGPWRGMAVAGLFLTREGYVHLLGTQYWAFLNSVMPVKAAASWFPRIAGIVCTVSAIAGAAVKPISSWFGSTYELVFITAFMLVLATVVSNEAFQRAPAKVEEDIAEARRTKDVQKTSLGDEAAADGASTEKRASSWVSRRLPRIFLIARAVFRKSSTLRALLWETIACQSLSAMLSLAFHSATRKHIASTAEHAAYVGRFYATVNVASALLQFIIVPAVLTLVSSDKSDGGDRQKIKQAARLLLLGPVLSFVILLVSWQKPSLLVISLAFGWQKTIEYSVRSSATELLYVPMDYDSKYLGKEVISVLGTRGGRSISSIGLMYLCTAVEPTSGFFSGIMAGAAVLWGVFAKTAQREASMMPLGKEEPSTSKASKQKVS